MGARVQIQVLCTSVVHTPATELPPRPLVVSNSPQLLSKVRQQLVQRHLTHLANGKTQEVVEVLPQGINVQSDLRVSWYFRDGSSGSPSGVSPGEFSFEDSPHCQQREPDLR